MNNNAILLGLVFLFAGCAGTGNQPPPSVAAQAAAPPAAVAGPRTITDLSQLAPSSRLALAMPQLTPETSPTGNGGRTSTVQQNVERFFVADIAQTRYHEGPVPAPGEVSLLNDKARKFSDFAYQLLNQTLAAARNIEPGRLNGRKLPDNIGETVLTAVMDSGGRLKEITIESHSGDHHLDQIIIDACKQGIWSRNPPPPARDADGKYRVRLHGQIRAASFDRKGVYHYRTTLGLEIL